MYAKFFAQDKVFAKLLSSYRPRWRYRRNFNERQNLQVRVGSIPRACGGTVEGCQEITPAKVYTPRVRGNPAERPLTPQELELYPARAGEPAVRYDTSTKGGAKSRGGGRPGLGEPWIAEGVFTGDVVPATGKGS